MEETRSEKRRMERRGRILWKIRPHFLAGCILAVCTLCTCAPKVENPGTKAAGAGTESADVQEKAGGGTESADVREKAGGGTESADVREKAGSGTKAADGQAEDGPGADVQLEGGSGDRDSKGAVEASPLETEQKAVYTQEYKDDSIDLWAEIQLYAKGDELYLLEEDLRFGFVGDELEVEPEELEKLMGTMEEMFQETFLEEYREVEGLSFAFEREGEGFLLSVRCEITEETAEGIADSGLVDMTEVEELCSLEKACRVLEEQGYTRTE